MPLVRPILSSSSYYNYDLASYLYEILTSFVPTSHSTKDSLISILIFIKNIQEIITIMVSYHVFSLFTSTLLNETINVAVQLTLENKKGLKFSENELTKLFRFTTLKMHLYFNGKIFDQVDGVPMGSPIAPDQLICLWVTMKKNCLNLIMIELLTFVTFYSF